MGTLEGLNTAPRYQKVASSPQIGPDPVAKTRFVHFSANFFFQNERAMELFRDGSRAVRTFWRVRRSELSAIVIWVQQVL